MTRILPRGFSVNGGAPAGATAAESKVMGPGEIRESACGIRAACSPRQVGRRLDLLFCLELERTKHGESQRQDEQAEGQAQPARDPDSLVRSRPPIQQITQAPG